MSVCVKMSVTRIANALLFIFVVLVSDAINLVIFNVLVKLLVIFFVLVKRNTTHTKILLNINRVLMI